MRLDQACSHVVDCEHKTAPVDESGEYFAVGTPAMRDHRIEYSEARRISRETFEQWTRRLTPQGGDLLLAREAPVGPIVQLPDSANVAPGQRTVLLRPNEALTSSQYLYYLLRSPRMQSELLVKAEGSTVHHLNVADIRALEIHLPPLPEQQAIAEVLGALDDKIAANTRLAATSLELVDCSLPPALDAATPVNLGTVVTVTKGVSYRSADLESDSSALVTLKSITRDGLYNANGLKPYEGKHKATQILQDGEVIVAQTDLTQAAEVVGRAVRVPASPTHERLIASLDLAIVRPLTGLDEFYMYGILRQSSFREHCRSSTSGTTVLHLGKQAIENYSVQLAPEKAQRAYADLVRPLLARAHAADTENRTLAATRDALLPKLMSGDLRVRDAEVALAEVL